ncbi:uncharacterized protein KY384_005572 [Bacidia gigantensis]|uniref:uncharacterized protein n=1 Tax=Bacidia gigantensis TaxID=2732470 RepID=UPI001D03ABF4|nr:uncharacterized protein KY384_005572 [Bacidia gigantensis]KAG8530090.1 hypothetical protein KY384_005572 [Bacidia gigantensis]
MHAAAASISLLHASRLPIMPGSNVGRWHHVTRVRPVQRLAARPIDAPAPSVADLADGLAKLTIQKVQPVRVASGSSRSSASSVSITKAAKKLVDDRIAARRHKVVSETVKQASNDKRGASAKPKSLAARSTGVAARKKKPVNIPSSVDARSASWTTVSDTTNSTSTWRTCSTSESRPCIAGSVKPHYPGSTADNSCSTSECPEAVTSDDESICDGGRRTMQLLLGPGYRPIMSKEEFRREYSGIDRRPPFVLDRDAHLWPDWDPVMGFRDCPDSRLDKFREDDEFQTTDKQPFVGRTPEERAEDDRSEGEWLSEVNAISLHLWNKKLHPEHGSSCFWCSYDGIRVHCDLDV